MTMTRIGLLLTRVAQTLTVALCAATVTASAAGSGADWPAFGGDPGGSQHSPLAQINKANVKQLKLAWQHRSGDFIDAPSPKGSLLQVHPFACERHAVFLYAAQSSICARSSERQGALGVRSTPTGFAHGPRGTVAAARDGEPLSRRGVLAGRQRR